ncbi:CGNR zinc finger domain-containing protein [Cohnella nanjingensis]|uniref:CGNR zinc finger domain-containing protein n=1 Tax=Cohnella nanjingensis TaxID=1387779 RepID=A0A7X0RKG0_9BACL|nr:CGNR zinc finger domain-containing protein [Cohnella nanjingensis]MBB6669132.1 CGNR zinc finger domain-containing protein [Cohnella nanjingensis]
MRYFFIDFLNSEYWDGLHEDSYVDRLGQPEWQDHVLGEWDMKPDAPLSEGDLAELRQLRAWLRGIVQRANASLPLPPNDIERMNGYLGQSSGTWRFSVNDDNAYRIDRQPTDRNLAWLESEIVLSFARLLTDGEPKRLKICENDRCKWIFYDASKNKSRKWCDHGICGNLMNVRRHRERKTKGAERDE